MSEISDETLMAYADGELDGAERVRVETYLARDPAGTERLAVFAATGKTLANLFDQPMREPVPQRLLDVVMCPVIPTAKDIVAPVPTASAIIIPFERAQRQPHPAVQRPWMLAAASLSLIAAGLGTFLVLQQSKSGDDAAFGIATTGDGAKIAGTELAAALNVTPGGSSITRTIDGVPASIKPVFTFASAGQTYCRQYEISRAEASTLAGVACHDAQGQWKIEAQVAAEDSVPSAGKITPAGKVSAASVDAVVDRMIAGDVLGLQDEASVMENNWKAIVQPAPETNR